MSKSGEGNSNTAGMEHLAEDFKIADVSVAEPESESASKPEEEQGALSVGQLSGICTQCFSASDELVKQGDKHAESTKEIMHFHSSVACPITQCSLELGGCDIITHMLNDHQQIEKHPVFNKHLKIFVELKMFEVMQMEGTTCAAVILCALQHEGDEMDDLIVAPTKQYIPYREDEYGMYLPFVLLMANSTLKCGDKVTCFWVATAHSTKNLKFRVAINNLDISRTVGETVRVQSLRNYPDPGTLCATEHECLYIEHEVMRYFYPKYDRSSGKVLISVQLKGL